MTLENKTHIRQFNLLSCDGSCMWSRLGAIISTVNSSKSPAPTAKQLHGKLTLQQELLPLLITAQLIYANCLNSGTFMGMYLRSLAHTGEVFLFLKATGFKVFSCTSSHHCVRVSPLTYEQIAFISPLYIYNWFLYCGYHNLRFYGPDGLPGQTESTSWQSELDDIYNLL